MKPFEEQLTAWIDDRLPAEEHAAFERELDNRPPEEAAAFRAEKRHVGDLRSLLRDHLQAPPLTSGDFFNHGILERIAADAREEEAGRAATGSARGWRRFFSLGEASSSSPASRGGGSLAPARLLAAGAACLLAAAVGIYALIPGVSSSGRHNPAAVAGATPMPLPTPEEARLAEVTPAPLPSPATPGPRSKDDGQFVLNDRQTPVPAPEVAPPTPPEAPKTSATLLHFDEQNADVLWLDGWDYLPEVNAEAPPAAPPVDAPKP